MACVWYVAALCAQRMNVECCAKKLFVFFAASEGYHKHSRASNSFASPSAAACHRVTAKCSFRLRNQTNAWRNRTSTPSDARIPLVHHRTTKSVGFLMGTMRNSRLVLSSRRNALPERRARLQKSALLERSAL